MVFLPAKQHKVNRVTKGLAVVAALLPLVALPTAEAATVLTLSPIPGYIQDTLQGSMCNAASGNTCFPVDYFPFSIPGGVAAIDFAIDTTIANTPDTNVVVFGYSHGAQVAAAWLAQHSGDLDAPSSAVLSFVLMGNANRAYGGSNTFVMPQTQYQVTDISRQYDYASDFPDNPFNLLAVINVFAGFAFLHDYRNVNPADPANARWTEGNITYILVPTPNLPLLEPLRLIGLTGLADALNAPLKALVELGYNRPVPFPTTAQQASPASTPAATGSALSTSVVSDPTEAPQGATVKLSPAPAPAKAADSAPTATGPEQANGVDKGLAVADDTVTTTPPPDRADVPDTVKTTTPPAAQPRQDDAIAAKPSTTAPTTHTTPTTDGNKVEPGKVGEKQATTKSGDQSPSTEDRENSAGSEE